IARAARCRSHSSNRRMAQHKLEEELTPGVCIKLVGIVRNRTITNARPEAGATKWRVVQYCNPAITSQRQNPFFHIATVDRVIDTDEVQLFVTHNLNQTFVLLREG